MLVFLCVCSGDLFCVVLETLKEQVSPEPEGKRQKTFGVDINYLLLLWSGK